MRRLELTLMTLPVLTLLALAPAAIEARDWKLNPGSFAHNYIKVVYGNEDWLVHPTGAYPAKVAETRKKAGYLPDYREVDDMEQTVQAGVKERPPAKVDASDLTANRGFENAKPGQLKPGGQIVDRYGSPQGTFVSPAGTPVAQRSLPPGSQTKEYGMYEVKKPIDVTTGTAKPAFGQPGKGQQIELPKTVDQHVKAGDLKRWPPDPVPANATSAKPPQAQAPPGQVVPGKAPQSHPVPGQQVQGQQVQGQSAPRPAAPSQAAPSQAAPRPAPPQ